MPGRYLRAALSEKGNMTNNMKIPVFKVQEDKNDVTTLIRLQQIQNGFVVRGCKQAIHYPDIATAAEAIKEGLIKTSWPVLTGRK